MSALVDDQLNSNNSPTLISYRATRWRREAEKVNGSNIDQGAEIREVQADFNEVARQRDEVDEAAVKRLRGSVRLVHSSNIAKLHWDAGEAA